MSTRLGIQVFVILAIILIRFAIKASKANGNKSGVSKATPPPFNGTSQQQSNSNPFQQSPPPFQNPFQQTPNSNPFQQTPPPVNQNPFQQTPPSFQNPFQQEADAFSQPSTRNATSNMGVGSQSFYCRYCGKKFSSVENLTRDTCFKHPNSDKGLQKHVLYNGAGRPNVGF